MEKQLIGRGLLAGALGGLVAFVFARLLAEPVIQRAIDYESGRDHAQEHLGAAAGGHAHAEDAEVFSRGVQGTIGLGLGTVLMGVALGALVAVVYAVCVGRTGRVRPRPLALLVGAAGFLAVYLVPFLKYPANPPAVGHGGTIGQRSALYLVMVVCSVLFLLLAVYYGRRLGERLGSWRAALVLGAAYVVVMGVVMALLPSFGHLQANVAEYGRHATETPLPLRDADGTIVYPGFPADLLYSFRLYSLGAQLLMWTTIALVFAPLAERVLRQGRTTDAHRAAVHV